MPRRVWRTAACGVPAVLLALAAGQRAIAQDSLDLQPPTRAVVAGRVVTPAGQKVNPMPGVQVTLHRVGPDAAGPLDSVRAGDDGRYTLRYTRAGSRQAVYFAAVVYRGVAYFSAPLVALQTAESDGAGEIVVFDTTTHALPYTIHGHHIVVGAPGPDGTRKIVEVYELSNDTTVTMVGRDSLTPVWTAPIPHDATNFVAGQGDVSPVTLQRDGDRVGLAAAFGPGVKQLSYSYTLPPSAFPLQLALERGTSVLEVLLEEPGAQVRSRPLRSMGEVTTQGRTFKRFLAQGAPRGESIRIDVPVTSAGTRARVLIGVAVLVALAMIGALTRALLRRAPRAAATDEAVTSVESLAAAIAALDARHESGDAALSEDRYTSERAELKARLTAALAAAVGPA